MMNCGFVLQYYYDVRFNRTMYNTIR